MMLSEVEHIIRVCQQHLEKSGTKGSEIEHYLTCYLLVHICGAYEKQIKEMIVERTRRANDDHVTSFVEKTLQTYRSLKIDDIKGNLLGKFSSDYVSAFEAKIKQTETVSRYSNIVQNRHWTAHGQSITMTFDELVESYEKSKKILSALSEVLNP